MRRTRFGALVVVGWLCAVTPAVAQDRDGFWIGFGGGWGSAGVQADNVTDAGRENSGVGYLRGGWALSNRLLLGGEFGLWSKTSAVERGTTMDVNIYHASATLSYYPSASGFFVKGGAGAAILDADVKSGSASMTLDLGTGFNVIAGAGYDIPMTRRVAFTPAVDYWYGTLGDVRVVGVPRPIFSNWKQNVFTATVGITFY